MVLSIRKKFFYYKRFELDIWGLMRTTLLIHPLHFVDLTEREAMKMARFNFFFRLKGKGFFYTKQKCYNYLPFSRRTSKICGLFWFFSNVKIKHFLSKIGRYVYRIDMKNLARKKRFVARYTLAVQLVKLFYGIYKSRQFKTLWKKAFGKFGSSEWNYFCLLEGRLCSVVYRAGFFCNMFESLKFVKQGWVWVDGEYKNSVYFYIIPMQMMGFNPVIKGTIFWSLLRRLNRAFTSTNTPKYMFISYIFLFFFWMRMPKGREFIGSISVDMLRACGYGT